METRTYLIRRLQVCREERRERKGGRGLKIWRVLLEDRGGSREEEVTIWRCRMIIMLGGHMKREFRIGHGRRGRVSAIPLEGRGQASPLLKNVRIARW